MLNNGLNNYGVCVYEWNCRLKVYMRIVTYYPKMKAARAHYDRIILSKDTPRVELLEYHYEGHALISDLIEARGRHMKHDS